MSGSKENDISKPPTILDSARVLAFAILDSTVEYTGKITVYMDGKLIGPVPCLAICQNEGERDYLLFYCNKKWKVLAAGGYPSFELTQERAEVAYRGSMAKWQQMP